MNTPYYLERALFVVGEPNSGKSTQLRSIFRDIRLGTGGKIPRGRRKLPEIYPLSNERCLYLRLTSPHEFGESVSGFLDKTEDKIVRNTPRRGRRWVFVSALQAHAAKKMPDVVKTCQSFLARFNPERIRIVFLSPDWHGTNLQADHNQLVGSLQANGRIEICWIDARDRRANGLFLADFLL
jgi:hypothetical protein